MWTPFCPFQICGILLRRGECLYRGIFIAEGKYDDGELGNTVYGINANKIREIKLVVCSKVSIECLSVFPLFFC